MPGEDEKEATKKKAKEVEETASRKGKEYAKKAKVCNIH